ncbi:winged helix-turn-helix domain-containing protein [Thermosediminibacter oceani]|uniref:Transcriptional regulator, ModE family n=1 Tax=Thermosediminibacter oceani (strain ATCC BAA-1034 / DSM 16646 / JW/IW-1228P) TaxID=555079 RepID=D9RXZ3_THEOJ|nr:LysR family transcriptional regulator [Thermosediminibacter oceani]ADL08217.1 putative transcriptional regulator, ModE family [Thermosediminibacter oceani DSM 16646]
MEIKYKIWIEHEGKQVFGDGIYRLLQLVEKYGSINQAAAAQKMSYRQAWGKIKKIEKRLGVKLLERHRGGENGGGAVLTETGKAMMSRYGELVDKIESLLASQISWK